MWFLDILPNWIFHIITLVGVVGVIASFLLGMIPFINTYKTALQVVSIAVLAFGIYMEGGISNQDRWESKVAEAQMKVLEAEKKAAEANGKIEYVYVEKKSKIREARDLSLIDVQNNADKMNKYCSVIPEVINIVNASALNQAGGKK